jgi:hypothetical protein
MTDLTDPVETIAEFGKSPKGMADYLRAEIKAAEEETEDWRKRAARVVKRYRDERDDDSGGSGYRRKYNILWSNIQTMLPAVFGRAPAPIVERRYLDPDNIARISSMILERCLTFQINTQRNFVDGIHNALEDRLLPGMGTVWVRYQVAQDTPTNTVTNDYYAKAMGESAVVDYVYWEDFGYVPARTWEEVPMVWRWVYMNRDELIKRFGEKIGNDVSLDFVAATRSSSGAGGGEKTDEPKHKVIKQAKIAEVWDKRRNLVTWISLTRDEPLDAKEDPVKFPGFFPCPKPLFATNTTGNTLPVPDFCMYQDQAYELDEITQRLYWLIKALKVVGVYDASQAAIQRMLTEGVENELIPIDTWAAFAEKGGIKGCVDFLPIEVIMKVVQALYEQRTKLIEDIYQITGISDIVRGAGNPNETATAQRIKSQFASIRLESMKSQMAAFVTEVLRLMAHVMTKFFKTETLIAQSSIEQTYDGKMAIKEAREAQMQRMQQMQPLPAQQPQQGPPPMNMPPPPMGGPQGRPPPMMPGGPQGMPPPPPSQPPPPPPQPDVIQQAIELLRNGRLLDFRIDVSAESLVEPDKVEERQARAAFLTSITQFMQAGVPAAAQTPELAPIVGALLTWGVRGFDVGKDVEGIIETSIQQLVAKAKQPKPPPPEDPKVQAAKVKAQADQAGDQAKAQSDMQQAMAELQMKQQAQQQESAQKMQELQAEMAADREKNAAEIQALREKNAAEIEAILIKANIQAQAAQQKAVTDATVSADSQQQSLAFNEAEHALAMKHEAEKPKGDDSGT